MEQGASARPHARTHSAESILKTIVDELAENEYLLKA